MPAFSKTESIGIAVQRRALSRSCSVGGNESVCRQAGEVGIDHSRISDTALGNRRQRTKNRICTSGQYPLLSFGLYGAVGALPGRKSLGPVLPQSETEFI